MKKLYFECGSGISGDMTVAALIDLGADTDVLMQTVSTIPLEGFGIKLSRVKKSGLDVQDFLVELGSEYENHDHDMDYLHGNNAEHTQMHDHTHGHTHDHENTHEHRHTHEHPHEHSHPHVHRGLKEVEEIIDKTEMTENARTVAKKIFNILGRAEAKAHGTTLENVHFHEVGAVDSIVDIISVAVCFDNLGINEVIVPVLKEGTGTIRCEHGIMPIPVPAVMGVAEENGLNIEITDVQGELITPTGAAIAAALKTVDKLPEKFMILKSGMGAGKREYNTTGILRIMLIEETEDRENSVWKLETNIDDCTGETLGYVMDCLMESGARDVYYTPVYMKKNRPAYVLTVICMEEDINNLENIIFRETTTIGIRKCKMSRTVLEREIKTLKTSMGNVDFKICKNGEETYIYPEYKSLINICRSLNISYQDAYVRAVEEYRQIYGDEA